VKSTSEPESSLARSKHFHIRSCSVAATDLPTVSGRVRLLHRMPFSFWGIRRKMSNATRCDGVESQRSGCRRTQESVACWNPRYTPFARPPENKTSRQCGPGHLRTPDPRPLRFWTVNCASRKSVGGSVPTSWQFIILRKHSSERRASA
jgi:hypothetical protein